MAGERQDPLSAWVWPDRQLAWVQTHSFDSRIDKIKTQFYRIEESEQLSDSKPILQRGKEDRREKDEFFAFDF